MYIKCSKPSIYLISVLTMLFLLACGTDDQSADNDEIIMISDLEMEAETEAETEAEREAETEAENQAEIENEIEANNEIEAEPLPEEADRQGNAELFGANLSDGIEFIDFDLLVTDPFAYANRTIQTEGIVRANCNKRGCWMELRSPRDPASKRVTVRFLDYGFFVPLDSRGALVRIEGSAAVETLSPEEVEYYRNEGYDPGVTNEDGSVTAIEFTATGVEMWNRNDD